MDFIINYVPSVPYFGSYHLPNAILALVLLFSYMILSVPQLAMMKALLDSLILLYPFQFFSKKFDTLFLRIYVDSFQGCNCYKDGTEPGTFDC